MNIKGKKYLKANFFDSITIMERNGGIECNVKCKHKMNFLDGQNNFMNNIENTKDDYKKVLEIVNYFLRYTEITSIEQNITIPNINTNNFICIGNNNRKLYLSINKNQYSSQIINNIINKYNMDKIEKVYDILNNNDVKLIRVIGKTNTFRYEVYDEVVYNFQVQKYSKTNKKIINIEYPLNKINLEHDFIIDLIDYIYNGYVLFKTKSYSFPADYNEFNGCELNDIFGHTILDIASEKGQQTKEFVNEIEQLIIQHNNKNYYNKLLQKTLF